HREPLTPRREQRAVFRQPYRARRKRQPGLFVERHLLLLAADVDRAIEHAFDASFALRQQWQPPAGRSEQGRLQFTRKCGVDRNVEGRAAEILVSLFRLVAPGGLPVRQLEVLIHRSLQIVVSRGVNLGWDARAIEDDARAE